MRTKKVSTIHAITLICGFAVMTSAEAVTITAISGNYSVGLSMSDPDGSFSDFQSSTNIEGTVSVVSNQPNPYHTGAGYVTNTILGGTNPGIAATVNSSVRVPGVDFSSSVTLSYALVFSIDAAADFSLYSSSSSWWPVASSDNGGASLNISLKRLDNSVIFNYDAPSTGVGGPYASGMILAGTYQLLIDGSVSAIGLPATSHSPFAPLVNGESKAGVSLQFSDAAVVPVPAAVWLFGSGLLGLIGVAKPSG